ncbi:hypothetical protein HDC92_000450 [Pedobacter sp. AK017]|nr:hypothetical protein [Pedobacter sp. AK017]
MHFTVSKVILHFCWRKNRPLKGPGRLVSEQYPNNSRVGEKESNLTAGKGYSFFTTLAQYFY